MKNIVSEINNSVLPLNRLDKAEEGIREVEEKSWEITQNTARQIRM